MRIGVVRYWADRPAAEHEVIARLSAAAAARGHHVVDLHPDGSCVSARNHGLPLDFVINLHFATPKNLDIPHVAPLWNPVRFYHHFGFVSHFSNQLSHDYLASCGSAIVDGTFRRFRPELFADGLPVLNHTVPARYLEPRFRSDRAVFYVGINWERMSGGPGRHDGLLRSLDGRGLSAIHGPEEVDGIRPWAGFATYRGELPFDGWSVIQAIADAGAALVLSSSEHYRDGVMSCRPFEAGAAGVPLISERHPFMVERFGQAVLFFDERAPMQEQAGEIQAHLARLNDDPDYALWMATRAQSLVRSNFNLDEQLDELCNWVARREADRTQPEKVAATAVVVPVRDHVAMREWFGENRQVLSRFAQVILAPPVSGPDWVGFDDLLNTPVQVVVGTRPDTTWSERASCASADLTGRLCFLLGLEQLWERYPAEVAACEGDARIIPAVAQDDWPGRPANERVPTLLCGRTVDWFDIPVAGVAVSAEYVRDLRSLLGPGLHLAVACEIGRSIDDEAPAFQPALSLQASETRLWSVDAKLGEERSRDADFIAALPAAKKPRFPKSVLREPGRPADDARRVSAEFRLPQSSIRIGAGFSHIEKQAGDQWWWATARRATLQLTNEAEDARVGTLEFRLNGPPSRVAGHLSKGAGAVRKVVIRLPGGDERRLEARGQKVALQLFAPPGYVSTIEFVCEGDPAHVPGDKRDLWWQLRSPTLLLRTTPGAPVIMEESAPEPGSEVGLTASRRRRTALKRLGRRLLSRA